MNMNYQINISAKGANIQTAVAWTDQEGRYNHWEFETTNVAEASKAVAEIIRKKTEWKPWPKK